MNLPLRKSDASRGQSPVRALTYFESLPEAHRTFAVVDHASAPHLKPNEYAVIDTTDTELQNGELYLIQYESGYRRRHIVQISTGHIHTMSGRRQLVWWARDLAGFRQTGTTTVLWSGERIPLFNGMSDGPYNPRGLQKKLLGRIVGYAASALTDILDPEAGMAD
jgi:hypothetical protein